MAVGRVCSVSFTNSCSLSILPCDASSETHTSSA